MISSVLIKNRYDLARGLIKGVQLSGHLLHQGDLFHFFREVGRTTQRLERRLSSQTELFPYSD